MVGGAISARYRESAMRSVHGTGKGGPSWAPSRRSAARAAAYGKLAADAARGAGAGCFFVDTRALMESRAATTAATSKPDDDGRRPDAAVVLAAMLSDGLHLSLAGNKLYFEAVMCVLRANDLGPDNVPMHFPGLPDAFEVELVGQ